jgi:hypothetical protein
LGAARLELVTPALKDQRTDTSTLFNNPSSKNTTTGEKSNPMDWPGRISLIGFSIGSVT